jgi:hypothetical protein
MSVGISRVLIETDCANLAAALKSPTFDLAPGGVIFREIRSLLALHFTLRGIVFVRRVCNQYCGPGASRWSMDDRSSVMSD